MKLSLQDIIVAVEGKCLNPERVENKWVTAITTDSRCLPQTSLFIPLKGERFDAHSFIGEVFNKGAIATLTMTEEVVDQRLCTIYVEDTGKALLALGNYYRRQFNIPVIGVTGSVGKTSTKEIIAAILSGKYNVHKTEGNFNNEIGLPLTLFKLEPQHEIAVIEMGMNHFGEIHNLSMAAEPEVAVITQIGTSHIENLGSREGIFKAKLEILDGLKEKGLLIVNGDNDLLGNISNVGVQTIFYGLEQDHAYRATNIVSEGDTTSAHFITPKGEYDMTIYALGEHMIYNTLAAIAIAEHFGLTEDEMKRGLATYTPAKMRMHITTYENGITVIDDTYNASPDSMCAALKVLKDYKSTGRKIAVLGDMLEMGEFAERLHQEVGQFAGEVGIDIVYAIGTLAQSIYEGSQKYTGTKAFYYETKEAWTKEANQLLHVGDTVLFKASRGMHFEEMLEAVGKVK